MSAWAKPGVKCVCIADAVGSINYLGFPRFRKGQIFTIDFLDHDETYGLFLGFVGLSPRHLGHIGGFRPLVTRTLDQDVELFRPLLTDLPVGEDA